MFIAIPHSTDLQLGSRPYVTILVCVICLAIHLAGFDQASLVYYPDSWNPIKMLVAALSHAGWFHLIGNLIFFCAFSPTLEIIVGSPLRYTAVLLALVFITQLVYSVTTLIAGMPIPTLGLSGVVMGVMGLSAYLMPRVHIRVFVWFVFFVKNIYMPVWLLALWYIGWDIFDLYIYGNSDGINLVEHVSGGLAGYLIGYYIFNDHREDIKEELEDAIEHARNQRDDNGMASSYSGGRKLENEIRIRDAAREREEFMSTLYQFAEVGKSSEAILLIIKDYELQKLSIEIYEELFERMQKWDSSRALICLGRLCAHLRIESQDYKRAIDMVLKCQSIDEDFVLADSTLVLYLAKRANDMGLHNVAYLLVRNAEQRYGDSVDTVQFAIFEIEQLWMYLDKPDLAKAVIKNLLLRELGTHREKVLLLASKL